MNWLPFSWNLLMKKLHGLLLSRGNDTGIYIILDAQWYLKAMEKTDCPLVLQIQPQI